MAKPKHLQTGQKGEALAADLMISKGFEVLERNYRFRKAEIDLIVRKDTLLVFVEVKARSNLMYGMPEEFVSKHKIKLVTAAAEHYTYSNKWHHNIRFDIIAIIFYPNGTSDIMHFEDAFY